VLQCVLQCIAVCRSVSQCVAVCRSVSQCVAVCRSVLQCVAVCCCASTGYRASLQRRSVFLNVSFCTSLFDVYRSVSTPIFGTPCSTIFGTPCSTLRRSMTLSITLSSNL